MSLDQIEANVPRHPAGHLVMDNHATRKTKLIRGWLAKRPPWHMHFMPTSAPSINRVERFFDLITGEQTGEASTARRSNPKPASMPSPAPTTPIQSHSAASA